MAGRVPGHFHLSSRLAAMYGARPVCLQAGAQVVQAGLDLLHRTEAVVADGAFITAKLG